MDFLVNVRIAVPPEVDDETVDLLRQAERRRAAELARRGFLVRLWRVPGAWENWGLWRAATEADLHHQLASLPLHPYMTIDVHPLEPHPNDPPRAPSDRD
ncbi:muconolactone Delta-isomerase [Streptomyces sp. NPDC058045]|uniref:muconolactone Delta-isomerase n=1 Tax=Streptomyces sp. NPDC058045 TaxID=3346311 RepID=UPI0036E2E036